MPMNPRYDEFIIPTIVLLKPSHNHLFQRIEGEKGVVKCQMLQRMLNHLVSSSRKSV